MGEGPVEDLGVDGTTVWRKWVGESWEPYRLLNPYVLRLLGPCCALLLRQLEQPSRFPDVPKQLGAELGEGGVRVDQARVRETPEYEMEGSGWMGELWKKEARQRNRSHETSCKGTGSFRSYGSCLCATRSYA